MAKRGPKPAPPALKLLRGGRRDRDAAAGPRATGRPDPPAHLDAIARAEWDRFAPELEAMGVLARVDGSALAIYCTAYSRWVRATAELAKPDGLTADTGQGGIKTSPYVHIATAAEYQMSRLLAEFGGTPSSRSRLAAPGEGPKDDLADFLRRRP